MKDDEAAVAALQKVFQDNLALTKKSKRLSIIGSVAAGLVVVVFSLIIFHQIRSFRVADLQSQLLHRGRPLLKSEFSTLGDQMTRRVYPLFKYELSTRLKFEAPKFRRVVRSQVGLLQQDIEAGLRQKLAEALHQAVITSLTKSGKGAVSLSAAQRQALNAMAQDTAAMLETEIKPLLAANAKAGVAKLSWMGGSFAKLQKTKLALQLRPVDANDATLKLVKSLVQLVLNKLNDPKSRKILNIDMLGNVRDLF